MSPLRMIAARHRRHELLPVAMCATLGAVPKRVGLASTASEVLRVDQTHISARVGDLPGARERRCLPVLEFSKVCPGRICFATAGLATVTCCRRGLSVNRAELNAGHCCLLLPSPASS